MFHFAKYKSFTVALALIATASLPAYAQHAQHGQHGQHGAAATTATTSAGAGAEQSADLGHKAGDNATIKTSVRSNSPLEVGKKSEMIITLKDATGAPVNLDQLVEMHTEKIHLLIVDPSLGDYHHIHPRKTETVGDYAFEFQPRRSGEYLFFADLVPVKSNAQEYSISKIEVPGEVKPLEKQQQRSVTVDGYKFELQFEDPNLVQGQSTKATIKVTGPDGKPFDKLEPVMGAYAHLVGFSENRDFVAHIHPQGKEPESKDERGGPELSFYMNITQPGYHLLYSQVQINGKDVFAPFGIEVAPRKIPNTVAGIFEEVDTNVARLDNVIQTGSLAQVHGLAFWIRDLLNALDKAEGVPAENKAKLQMSLKRLQSYADLLDRYGDSGQAEQTKGVYVRFTEEIKTVRDLVKAPAPKEAAQAKPLNNQNCPVSKMPVGSMEPGASMVYNGIKIGLCCAGCEETFKEHPEEYLKKAQESVKK